MKDNSELIPLDQFFIRNDKPLFWELATNVTGLGLANSFYVLKNLVTSQKINSICYKDLSNEEKDLLFSFIKDRELKSNKRFANRKNRLSSESDNTNAIIIGQNLKINFKKDIINLKKEKCRIGERHAVGLKVHGQRTRTTGKASTINASKSNKPVKSVKTVSKSKK